PFAGELPQPSQSRIRLIFGLPTGSDRRRSRTNPVNMNQLSAKANTVLISRVVVVSLLGAFLGLTGCSSAAAPKEQNAHAAGPRSVSVAVAPVVRQDVPVYLSGLGSVTAFNTANIKSRVDGQIMKVNVREGQEVRE